TEKVTDGEAGGITQHIGAYSVKADKGYITLLDTPGHEAFTSMRKRGAHITDIVVLVVAADDGIKPQTIEAIDHAKAANVPIVVALNKIDRPNADLDRVKQQLIEYDLAPEEWGGKTICAGVSAITGEGIDDLLEFVLLEAEMLELKANPDKQASGIVIEAHMSQGKGAMTTLIVQSGTLREGDFVVVGPHYGKVRAMLNDHGQNISKAGPSVPVEILGLSQVPDAGDLFYSVETEKIAKEISDRKLAQIKDDKLNSGEKVTLDNLYSVLGAGVQELNVILKSDVQGSLEAAVESLRKLPSDKIRVKFVHAGVGEVNASDVVLAQASKAIILAFHVGIDKRAAAENKKDPIEIREYKIIYDLIEDMHKALEGQLDAIIKKNFLSRVEVKEVFRLSKQGTVAGCLVAQGKINRKAHVDVMRNGDVVFSGRISNLKRFKDDVKEVSEGMECGISIEGFDKYQSGDVFEAFEIEKIAQRL
ncbi:MAG: translation initiation factor IF-2, partial [Candidatus Omnitrophota bacterium]